MAARRAPRLSRGFTLTELLVTATVIGIIATTVAVGTTGAGGHRLDAVEIQLNDMLDRAQGLARSSRVAYGVVFDLENERMALVDETGAVAEDPFTKKDHIVEFARPGQAQGVEIESANFSGMTTFLVDPQGVPLAGGSVVFTHKDLTMTLTMDAATGLVTRS